MFYDLIILVCIIFALLIAAVAVYIPYKLVFVFTDQLFEYDDSFGSSLIKWVLRIVLFPLALCVIFFFLGTPILFVLGVAVQLGFHGH